MDAAKKCFAVLFSLGLLGGLLRIGLCAESAQKDAPENKITVLSGGCNWRKDYVFFPPRLSVEAARKAGLSTDLDFRIKYLIGDYHLRPEKKMVYAGCAGGVEPNYFTNFETSCPPSTWRNVDFNDESWMETSGTDFTGQRCAMARSQEGLYPQRWELPPPRKERLAMVWGTDQFCNEIGLICMRGKFLVKDRAKVKKLSLSLSYRGGFVAYLNGKEVARASLPDVKLDPTTPAEEYPLDV